MKKIQKKQMQKRHQGNELICLNVNSFFLGDNVVAFANAAVENVASAIRPCIIIVHNKCNLHEPMDIDLMTQKFVQLHEAGDVCHQYHHHHHHHYHFHHHR